jgi:predicted DNA binding CopG/RHH family protein
MKKKGTKEIGRGGIEIEYLGNADEAGYELTAEQQARADEATADADAEDAECRVNFRWKKDQLKLVKAVAEHIGIPYQAYIKQVLAERVAEDYAKIPQVASKSASSQSSPMFTYIAAFAAMDTLLERAQSRNEFGQIVRENLNQVANTDVQHIEQLADAIEKLMRGANSALQGELKSSKNSQKPM